MKTILAILAAIVTAAAAEPVTVTLKSGGTMKGPLVGKTANEIKIETAYGIITLQSTAVTPESWATAQRATLSKPSGKYAQPNAIVAPTIKVKGSTKPTAIDSAASKEPYDVGVFDGRMAGKQDATTGKTWDEESVNRLIKMHSAQFPKADDRIDYARGCRKGYDEGYSKHRKPAPRQIYDRNGLGY